jgi:hypothetical protein
MRLQSLATAGAALALLGSFTVFLANPAKAATFTFSQGGWQYGGNLSGSFTGDDLNGNGDIEASELSAFSATFSGNLFLGNHPDTGDPIIPFFTLSHSLPSLEPNNVETHFSFSYSSSTSQLSFYSFRQTCLLRPPYGGCVRPQSYSSIAVSGAGGTVNFDPSPMLGRTVFRTSSSSTPVVTPLQQSVPEPSALTGTLLVGLGCLLRKKVVSSRTAKEKALVR